MPSLPPPSPDDLDDPDVAFQAGFGFYLGLVGTGIAAIGGVLADVTTATLLGLLPSTLLIVTVAGHIGAKRAHGLQERIGYSRLRRLASYVPPLGFATVPIGLALAPTSAPVAGSARLSVVSFAFVLLTGVLGFAVNHLARTRYVDAVADDEPAARWTWHRAGLRSGSTVAAVGGAALLVAGLISAVAGSWVGLAWAGYGAFLLASSRSDEDAGWLDPTKQWNPPEIRVHDAGIVLSDRTLVPWNAIADVRLTDDELVIERTDSWFDVRCDRGEIEDADDVLAEIERARRGESGDGGDRTEGGDDSADADTAETDVDPLTERT